MRDQGMTAQGSSILPSSLCISSWSVHHAISYRLLPFGPCDYTPSTDCWINQSRWSRPLSREFNSALVYTQFQPGDQSVTPPRYVTFQRFPVLATGKTMETVGRNRCKRHSPG